MMQLALMQRVCLFDGERIALDDIMAPIKGKDFMQPLSGQRAMLRQ